MKPDRPTVQMLLKNNLQLIARAKASCGLLLVGSWAVDMLFTLEVHPQLEALAEPSAWNPSLARPLATIVLGWAGSCLVQALWARVAARYWARETLSVAAAWQSLEGSWATMGTLVAYAAILGLVYAWPSPLHGVLAANLSLNTLGALALVLAVLSWVGMRTQLSLPAAAAARLGSMASLRASWRATRGRLGLSLALGLVPAATSGIAGGLAGLILATLELPQGELLAQATGSLAKVVWSAVPGLFYLSAHERQA